MTTIRRPSRDAHSPGLRMPRGGSHLACPAGWGGHPACPARQRPPIGPFGFRRSAADQSGHPSPKRKLRVWPRQRPAEGGGEYRDGRQSGTNCVNPPGPAVAGHPQLALRARMVRPYTAPCLLAAVLAAIFVMPVRAIGQDAGKPADQPVAADKVPAQTTPAPVQPDSQDARPLPERQKEVQERLARLEERMQRLAKLLGEDEPDKSVKLLDALERSREKRLTARTEEIATLLKTLQYGDAERSQERLMRDLEEVLAVLTETLSDLDARRAERERLEAIRRSIRTLIQEQSENLFRTRASKSDAQRAEAIQRAIDQLEQLERKQAELREGGQQSGEQSGEQPPEATPKPADRAAEQKALEEQARDLAEQLRKMAESIAGEQSAPSESGDPSPPGGSKETPSQPSVPSVPSVAPQSAEAQSAQDTQQAAEAMKQAAEALEIDKSSAAKEDQQRAEEQLRRAIRRLREEQQKLREKADLDEIEKTQRGLEQKAGGVEQQMQQGETPSKKTPGKENMGNARQQMQRAADRLGEESVEPAEQAQEQAIDELQQTLDQVDEALRQMRREEMEETLAALEVRFRRMLTAEQDIQASLADLNLKDPKEWRRAEQMRLAESAQSQKDVAADCRTVERIVVQEGTTVIFPEIVGQLAGDMEEIGRRLDLGDIAEQTQATLQGVIDVLQEIVAAIEQKREDMQDPEDQHDAPNSQEGQPQPLLPGSAELKLLKSRQLGINRRTAALGEEMGEQPTPEQAAQFERLTERQRLLSDLTRKMNERK